MVKAVERVIFSGKLEEFFTSTSCHSWMLSHIIQGVITNEWEKRGVATNWWQPSQVT